MKKVRRLTFFLLLFFSLAAAGCESQADGSTAGVLSTPTETPTAAPTVTVPPKVEAIITPSHTPARVAQPTETKTPTPTDVPITEQLACGEVFCQLDWPGHLLRPISSEFRNTIEMTYPYANTMGGKLDVHHGVEFPHLFGTPVRAVADGEVLFAGNDDLTLLGPYTGFYGNIVILRHPEFYQNQDLFSLYAHLSEIEVEKGDQISAGQILGEVGASGAADGSHLHFEVRINENDYKQTLNPVLWFAPVQEESGSRSSSLAGRIIDSFGRPLSEFEFVLEKRGNEATNPERFYPMTYVSYGVNPHPLLEENFAYPDIPPGAYRLVFIAGRVYEVEFELEPGALGFIQIQLD